MNKTTIWNSSGVNIDGMCISWRAIELADGTLCFPTPEMIRDTITRYKLVRKLLASGEDTDGYDFPEHEPVISSQEYRVSIFGDVVVRLGELGTFRAKEFSFNESTPPQTALDLMREGMKGLWLAGYLQSSQPPNGKLATTAQEFHDHANANGGEVDLAQQFPRNPNTQPIAGGKNPTSNVTSEGVFITNFDNKKFGEYTEAYKGQTVTVRMSAIKRTLNKFDDPVFAFIPFFNDSPSKFAPWQLDQRIPPDEDARWKYNDGVLITISQLVPEFGDTVTGDFYVTFKLNESEKRVYWNVSNVERQDYNDSGDGFEGELSDDDLNELMSQQSDIPF